MKNYSRIEVNETILLQEWVIRCNELLFLQLNKCYKPHKPDSVSTLSFICSRYYYRDVAAYPGSSGEPPCSEPLHGITAPKVYPLCTLLHKAVSSYLTFSPS